MKSRYDFPLPWIPVITLISPLKISGNYAAFINKYILFLLENQDYLEKTASRQPYRSIQLTVLTSHCNKTILYS